MDFIDKSIATVTNLCKRMERKAGNETASVIYVLICVFLFYSMMIFQKIYQDQITPLQVLTWRGLVSTIMMYTIMKRMKIDMHSNSRKITFQKDFRNIAGAFLNVMVFFTISKLPLTTVNLIHAAGPFWVILLDWIMVRTKYSKLELLIFLLSACGVFLVLVPDLQASFNEDQSTSKYVTGYARLLWILLLFMTLAVWAWSVVVIKKMTTINILTLNFPFFIILTVLGAGGQLAVGKLVQPDFGFFVMSSLYLGAVTFICQHTYVRALQIGRPAKINMFANLYPVFGFLFEVFYYHEYPTLIKVIGASITIGCSLKVALQKLKE